MFTDGFAVTSDYYWYLKRWVLVLIHVIAKMTEDIVLDLAIYEQSILHAKYRNKYNFVYEISFSFQ